jgi:hypothetical protein
MSGRVFLTCWLIYTAFWTPYIVREHFPAAALSERGSLNVESYLGWSDDIFRGPQGGAYINNNPGASIAGAIPLILLRPWLGAIERWNEKRPPAILRDTSDPILVLAVATRREFYLLAIGFLTVALVMAPATAGVLAYLCSRLREAGVPARSAALAALLCGLATPLFYRAAYLNHNLLEADAGFAALLAVWDPHRKPRAGGRTVTEPRPAGSGCAVRAALAGGLAGYALLCDYSGVVVLLAVGAYVLARDRSWKSALAFAAGAAPMICALLLYQTWAFGSFYRPSQHFMTPTAPTSHGYRGIDWPSARLMWANFFDPRFGLFIYCPALLAAFAAPLATGDAKRVRFRIPPLETAILFGYFGLFVLFCAANQYSWLQPLTGFRYLVPVVPGLALLAIQASQALGPPLKWLLASAALIETFIFAAGHESSFASSVRALLVHRFELPWMVRLSDVGVKIPEGAPIIFAAMLAIALAWIWTPAMRQRREPRRAAALAMLLLAGFGQCGCNGAARITFQARVSDLRRPATYSALRTRIDGVYPPWATAAGTEDRIPARRLYGCSRIRYTLPRLRVDGVVQELSVPSESFHGPALWGLRPRWTAIRVLRTCVLKRMGRGPAL